MEIAECCAAADKKRRKKKKQPTDCHSVAGSVGNEDDFLCIALMHRVRDESLRKHSDASLKAMIIPS